MNRNIENTLGGLIPTLSGPVPEELVTLAASLVTQSRSKASNLKPEEEIARGYACAHLAAERLKQRFNLPKIEPRPPCPPRVYQALYRHLENAIPERRGRGRPKKIDIASAMAGDEEGVPKTSTGSEEKGRGRQPPNGNRSNSGADLSRKRKAPGDEDIPLITPQRGRGRPRKITSHHPLPEPSNDDKVPLWVMPMVRHVCKTLETPAAPPHVYAGVSSVLPRFQEEDSHKDGREKRDGGIVQSTQEPESVTPLDETEAPTDSTGESQGAEQHQRQDELQPPDVNTPPKSNTVASTAVDGSTKRVAKPNGRLHLPPLILAVYFFVVARLMNQETSPEEYMRLRRQAMDAIGVWAASLTPDARKKFIADPATAKFMGSGVERALNTGNSGSQVISDTQTTSNDANDNANATATEEAPELQDRSTLENAFNDQFFFPSGLVDRALQNMAKQGWLKMEWFQNIIPGAGVRVGGGDSSIPDAADAAADISANDGRRRGRPGRPRRQVATSDPDAMDIDTPQELDEDDQDVYAEREDDEAEQQAFVAQDDPSLQSGLGSMLNPRVDFLHPARREEYKDWKAGILARVDEVELQRSAAGAPNPVAV
ncbi:hypothetical protein L228DRAFT_263754 [Xylona heveae TC161]|uniref:ORC6 first cyclin-like domain-containing protein n=1 Tax=Xylona heveae (strain CBS 132557 / TC161) TaxID=1328760 RepID=A0A164ZRN7_XYLHT|nr:hypothetical protein L228DRAFT_263754 [Xylona heveae TC161]KZF19426.1 hypothetical protein L228DRAFT_263754 [Xylona heveae TC161]